MIISRLVCHHNVQGCAGVAGSFVAEVVSVTVVSITCLPCPV